MKVSAHRTSQHFSSTGSSTADAWTPRRRLDDVQINEQGSTERQTKQARSRSCSAAEDIQPCAYRGIADLTRWQQQLRERYLGGGRGGQVRPHPELLLQTISAESNEISSLRTLLSIFEVIFRTTAILDAMSTCSSRALVRQCTHTSLQQE